MLIDRTYFIGDIEIANANLNTSPCPVGALVDWYIERYEPEFLEKALGLSLYTALLVGYGQPTPDQKWIDLVQGTLYTDCQNKQKRWRGLITQPQSVLDSFDVLGRRHIKVGRGQDIYDPVANSATTIIPPEFVGKQFVFHKRAFDDLIKTEEYTVSGNVLTLVDGVFSVNDIFWYKAATLVVNTSTGTAKQSPVAYYVYYWFQRYGYTQTTTMSEVRTKSENADVADPFQKACTAWNRMVKWVIELADYMNTKQDVYPEWKDQSICDLRKTFRTINEHGI